ncbi:6-phosphofructo-2-kinase/fructose-2,6-bisphosphatase [Symbiodinium microadriaticum]|uniref:6-phosphofructo-2-kinase/fructose-2, 6-bisphosphatase n=1 Tax=Symbiodinium microadriaticum TaxID=2951 RepID=A0A1Q9BVR8_SYMMI|nr:6-phosphofructo-2-kinase/fructose-2,6-bisphosphatase [Symbiodinium microadriaticum]
MAGRLGFWNSTVVRAKMSEYLCALTYKEALQFLRGELEPDHIMAESLQTAHIMLRHIPEVDKQLVTAAHFALILEEQTKVFTSTMPRAVESAFPTSALPDKRSALNPIDKGVVGAGWWDVECPDDVPPWSEVEKRHPDFMDQWHKNPLVCQFPGGESYLDVIMRLESVLIDVEMCTSPVLIVSHITVLQLLLAYFKGVPVEEAWKMSLPKFGVVEVNPTSGGSFLCEEHLLSSQPTGDGTSTSLEKRCRDDASESASIMAADVELP